MTNQNNQIKLPTSQKETAVLNIPNEISAAEFYKRCRSRNEDLTKLDGLWVPARHLSVGLNFFDETRTRFQLAWKVFSGKADVLSWEPTPPNDQ